MAPVNWSELNWADKCTLNLGSCLFGIPIRLHITYFILLIIQVISAAAQHHLIQYTALILVLYGPVLFVTILIHEFGHALMNRRFGGHVDHILIWPLGGFAIIGPTGGNVLEDFWVAFAGPLTHIPQILFWVIIYAIFSGGDFSEFDRYIRFYELDGGGFIEFMKILACQTTELNILLILLNLFVPAYPLDGGRCLAALLVHFGVRVQKAAYITAITAMVAALVLIVWGFYTLVHNGRNNGFLFILIAAFILWSSANLFRMTKLGRVYDHPLFDRPCYRQRDENRGVVSQPSSIKKKKKRARQNDIENPCLPEEEAPERAPQDTQVKKSTKKKSVKKAEPTSQGKSKLSKSTKPKSERKSELSSSTTTKPKGEKKSELSSSTTTTKPKSEKKSELSKSSKKEKKPATDSDLRDTEVIENVVAEIAKRFEKAKQSAKK